MSAQANPLFSATGATLRAAAAAGDAAAIAELARRAAKRDAQGWTVAAARSQGRADIVATKVAPKPAPAVAFARKVEKVVAAPKRDSLKAVRTDMARIEDTLAKLVDGQAKMAALLAKLA